MLKANQLIKATGLHSKSEVIAVVDADQEVGKPVRVMSVVDFQHYDVDVSQITCVADGDVSKDTPLIQIKWNKFN